VELRILREVKLTGEPTLVAGLPDMGNVAGIALEHIISQTKAEQSAEITADYPPWVSHRGKLIEFQRATYRFHLSEKKNLITFSGEGQPPYSRTLYELCEKVVEYAKPLGVKTICTIGGAFYGETSPSAVYGGVTDSELFGKLKDLGVKELSGDGRITGFNGLILGIAKERGLQGICLLGEISNPEIPQPLAAANVIDILSKYLGLAITTSDLVAKEREIKEIFKREVEAEAFGFRAQKRDERVGIA
jgi:proteasome assembly chaperone (PAC2) family protein